MKIWRLKMKSAAEEGVDPREFCFNNCLLGVGWQTPGRLGELEGEEGWQTYREQAERHFKVENNDRGWWPALNAIHNKMKVDDLVWARDGDGVYYLGRVKGDWRYIDDGEHGRANIVNIRDCEWHKAGAEDAVPGGVARRLHMGRTLQEIHDPTIEDFSKLRYNELSGGDRYEVRPSRADLFSLLSADACEDLVALYLQVKDGYRIVPSTCRSSTPTYEFVMRHEATGERAFVQVKAGSESLPPAEYMDLPGTVFLFAAKGDYPGSCPPNVRCLRRRDLITFARQMRLLLPQTIGVWMDLAEA